MMKKMLHNAPLFAVLAGVAWMPGSLDAQTPVAITNLLFAEDFSSYSLDTLPTTVAEGGLWATATHTGPGVCAVVEDAGGAFGQGTTNKYLRVSSTYSVSLITPLYFQQDVMSFAFDYIGHYPVGDGSRWLNVGARIGTTYAHYTSIRNNNGLLRTATTDVPANPSIGGLDVPLRVLTILNNRADSISYERPDGLGTTNLDSNRASVWIYHYTGAQAGTWQHLMPQYLYSASVTNLGRMLDNLQFTLDSNTALRSFDLDNIEIRGIRTLLPTVQVAITNKLFAEDFESYDPGTPPTTVAAGGKWGTATWQGTNGSWGVLKDANDAFGFGATNRFLQLSNTHNLSPGLITPVFEPQEALIYAFDFIGRIYNDDGSRWLNVDARDASGAAHTTSPLMYAAQIRVSSGNVSYGGNDLPIRILTVVNNREGSIVYDRPDGLGTATLGAARASLWLFHYSGSYWEPLVSEYIYARTANFPYGTAMDRVRFFMDSNAIWRSFDLDNVAVFGSIAPPPPPVVLSASINGGNIEIRWQGRVGKSYQVKYRTSVDSGTWSDLGAAIVPGADGEQLVTDSLLADAARFYRVEESTVTP